MQSARDGQGHQLYDEREIRSIIDLLLEEVCGVSRADRVLHPDQTLDASKRDQLLHIAALLAQGIPVQQALGYEWFCGQRFDVTSDVLIPRPETAELVEWIVCDATDGAAVSDAIDSLQILDIGTGSGCIALSLSRLINNSLVTALDLSTAALDVACRNACQQGVDNVQFVQCDILDTVDNCVFHAYIPQLSTINPPIHSQQNAQALSTEYPLQIGDCPQSSTGCPPMFDIIVSNPPYICQSEAGEMSDLVLSHEPHLALFVPDIDPLRFYRAIASFALKHLNPHGTLYFEINAAYGRETCQLLHEAGFRSVELRQDIHGRDRMVRARDFSITKE